MEDLISEIIGHLHKEDRFLAAQIDRTYRKVCLREVVHIDDSKIFLRAFSKGDLLSLARKKIFYKSYDAVGAACQRGSIPLVKLLIKHDCCRNLVSSAYEGGHRSLCDYLKEIGHWELHSAFAGACRNGNLETINGLYNQSDPGIRWFCIAMAINIASRKGNLELLKTFVDQLQMSPQQITDRYVDACIHGHLKIMEFYVHRGFDFQSLPPFQIADCCYFLAQYGLVDQLETWFQSGITIDFDGCLRSACYENRLEVVRWCLQHGQTPTGNHLEIAQEKGHDALVSELLKMIH